MKKLINLGRLIVKNPISKIAVAAVIIIACMTALTMFERTSGIALANVLNQIEKIGTYMYQMDITVTGSQSFSNRTINTNLEIDGNALMSQEYGVKMTKQSLNLDSQETTSQEIYLLLKEKTLITLLHEEKYYSCMEIDDTYLEMFKDQNHDPGKIVEQFLTSGYKSIGISTIDGIKVEGFETKDPKYAGGMFDKVDIKLWIDVKTQLPVLMNMDYTTKGPKIISYSGVIDNFQWNIPIDASDFEPIIPTDYSSELSSSVLEHYFD